MLSYLLDSSSYITLGDVLSAETLLLKAAKNFPISTSCPGLWVCILYISIGAFSGSRSIEAVARQPRSYLVHLSCLNNFSITLIN